MKTTDILPAWLRILSGYRPFLSIEITKECPLRCPGCYAYEPQHLGQTLLRDLTDSRGSDLVEGVMALVRRHKPIHISIVGGEPLVRYRELSELLPKLDAAGVEVQLVTSAVRPIPQEWAGLRCLHPVVSVDGLPEHHDRRRAPATYDRILRHMAGHRVTIHCTVSSQMCRPGYLDEFASFWSDREEARQIWFSLFTPQDEGNSEERLSVEDRSFVVREIERLRHRHPKVRMPASVLKAYERPPSSPKDCIFAQTTTCVSADLKTHVTPCQLGGRPVCSECGCMASAGLTAIGRKRLAGFVRVSDVFTASHTIGRLVGRAKANSNGHSL